MLIEKVKLSDIKPNTNNPRILNKDKFKKLTQSIKHFPEMLEIRPIVVDDDMVVLGGNMRLKACEKAGLKEVWIIRTKNLTDEQKREFIIKDNVGYGDWDWEILKNDWDGNVILEWGLDLPNNFFDDTDNDNNDDRDIKISNLYQIALEFNSEDELKENYDKLIKLNYSPKIIIV